MFPGRSLPHTLLRLDLHPPLSPADMEREAMRVGGERFLFKEGLHSRGNILQGSWGSRHQGWRQAGAYRLVQMTWLKAGLCAWHLATASPLTGLASLELGFSLHPALCPSSLTKTDPFDKD